jgi:hypothetical protein
MGQFVVDLLSWFEGEERRELIDMTGHLFLLSASQIFNIFSSTIHFGCRWKVELVVLNVDVEELKCVVDVGVDIGMGVIVEVEL